jgi:hypothetical protein
MVDFNHIILVLEALERRVRAMAPYPVSAAGTSAQCLRRHWRCQLGQQVFLLRYLPKFKFNLHLPWPHRQQPLQPQLLQRWTTQWPLWANYQRAVQRAELNTTMAPDDGLKVLCQAIHPILEASQHLLAHLVT